MTESYLRQSALAHLGLAARAVDDPGEAGVILCERPFRGQLNLRGDARTKRFRDAVEGALGVVPPRKANNAAEAGDITCLWLGPDEWLIVTPDERTPKALEALDAALAKLSTAAVTDVSDARAVIGLGGPRARDVMMKGCSLDLHPRVFRPGHCAQSLLAKAQVILHQLDDKPTYDLYVARSFAEYLWAWLEDASLEYGMAVVAG